MTQGEEQSLKSLKLKNMGNLFVQEVEKEDIEHKERLETILKAGVRQIQEILTDYATNEHEEFLRFVLQQNGNDSNNALS